jgi:signal transduction histidine kinase
MIALTVLRGRLRQQAGGANRRATMLSLGLLALLLALLSVADGWYAEQLRLKQQAATAVEVQARGQGLATVVNSQLSRLHGLAGFASAAASEAAIGAEFETYTDSLYTISPGVTVMALAPVGIVAYEATVAAGHALLGEDLSEDPNPEVRAAAVRAATSEEPVLAGPLRLEDGTLALIATRAIFHEGTYWGLAQVRIDVEALAEEVSLLPSVGELELALRDSQSRVFVGSFTVFAQSPAQTEVPVANERWTLAGIPRGGWDAAIRGDLLLGRAGGLLLVALLTTVVYLTVDRQERLQRAVDWRTRELAEERALLEQRVRARTRELQTLLDVSRNVASTLDFPSLLSILLDQLQQVVDFSGLAVYLFQNGERVELAQYYGAPPQGQTAQKWKEKPPLPSAGLRELRTPLIIGDMRTDTGQVAHWRETMGELPAAEGIQPASWMAVPMLLQNRVLGVLVFYHTTANYYTGPRAALALAMANHVAVAIENARLYEQAQALAALQERQKLARELHDSVSQALYGIGLGTHTVLELLERNDRAVPANDLRPPLEYTLSLAKSALVDMRALIFELRPESLEAEGLIPALTRLSDVLEARHQLAVQKTFAAEPDLSLAAKEVLYRVAQEALHNVAKHAQASQVTVSLAAADGEIILEISDNGMGFDPQGHFPGHLGLQSMRERVEGIGGRLTVESAAGSGTTIGAHVPLQTE